MKYERNVLRAALIGAALICAPTSSAQAENGVFVVGLGNRTCSYWTGIEQGNGDTINRVGRLTLSSWLGGFISGVNASSDTVQIGQEFDVSELKAWMNNYCREHPLDTVHRAAVNLAKDLRARKPS